MRIRVREAAGVVAAIWLCLGSSAPAQAQKEKGVAEQANGTFEVKLTPQTTGDERLGRMSIDKQFHGDLQGTAKGEMLTALTAVKDSAGYVAIERLTGTLKGRNGTFVLQHNGTMSRGAQNLAIAIVPDSGTDQLAGIAGTMTIRIEGAKHFYGLQYTLPDVP